MEQQLAVAGSRAYPWMQHRLSVEMLGAEPHPRSRATKTPSTQPRLVHAAADQMARLYSDGNGLVRQQPGVLHSAFAVVRVLGRMQFPVGVTRLAAETGIPKTTVHRLLEQLADENVVERVERRWILGGGLHDLDRRLQNLASVAHPRLRSIAQATGASLFLYARSGQRLDVMSCSYGARPGSDSQGRETSSAPRPRTRSR